MEGTQPGYLALVLIYILFFTNLHVGLERTNFKNLKSNLFAQSPRAVYPVSLPLRRSAGRLCLLSDLHPRLDFENLRVCL